MSKQTKKSQIASDQQLIAGIQKHLATSTLIIDGKNYLGSALVTLLQPRIDAGQASVAARAIWQNAVTADDAVLTETDDIVIQLKQTLQLMYGNDAATLADFGVLPRKKATRSPATNVAAATKAKATREARHTLGSKQKKAITGATVAPVVAPPAGSSGSTGSSTPHS
jgi:hypothetical protein